MYHFLLTFSSNCVCISCHFCDVQHRKILWPWNPVTGHSRSFKAVPFDRLGMISY